MFKFIKLKQKKWQRNFLSLLSMISFYCLRSNNLKNFMKKKWYDVSLYVWYIWYIKTYFLCCNFVVVFFVFLEFSSISIFLIFIVYPCYTGITAMTNGSIVYTGQQMAPPPPPPPPPRPPSPMFVSVPPRTQRLLHSEAYLRWVMIVSGIFKHLSE